MTREVIAPLTAWNAEADRATMLGPGTLLYGDRIEKSSQSAIDAGAEPYVAWFEALGRQYRCALPIFQARTQVVAGVRAEAAR